MITVEIKKPADIAPIDRTSEINWKSFNLQRAITSQVDTATFQLIYNEGKSSAFLVENGDTVFIKEDGVTLFGGRVVRSKEVIKGGLLLGSTITAKDFAYEMDSVLVARRFIDVPLQDVLQEIVDTILPAGFTLETDLVQEAGTIAFNYELPSMVFKQIAKIVNFDWYVDENKVIKFFAKQSVIGLFSLSDTTGNYNFKSLVIQRDIANLKNSITVIGGKFEAIERTDDQVTDGDKTVYILPFFYNAISITLDGVPQIVAVASSPEASDPSTEVIFNNADRTIEFVTLPGSGLTIAVTGQPLLPIIIKVVDPASVSAFGAVFEEKIIDKTIESRDLAIQRAIAEIEVWGSEQNKGSFVTQIPGLNVGDKINIDSVIRDINETVLITRISSKPLTPEKFEHTVTFATSETFGMIEFLQGLLTAQDKAVEINFDEDIETISLLKDTIRVIEDNIVSTINNRTVYEWSPTVAENVALWNFSVWEGTGTVAPYEFQDGTDIDFQDGTEYTFNTSYYFDVL
ncbi:MAG: hypothetical protein KAS32_00090 [Candidatus Peribacteraceae bacterium]|nr:hypothetical protein [Candidatus Peribacteraceae bacterium]